MNRFSTFYKKLSLTHQVLVVIFLFIVFFFGFFFVFLNDNIDHTIDNQMYRMMETRQNSILTVLESDSDVWKDDLFQKMMIDQYQTNCFIVDNKLNVFDEEKNVPEALYVTLLKEASKMNEDEETIQDTISVNNRTYFYRLIKVDKNYGDIVIASYMNDSYANKMRSTLVDSTIYITIFAYLLMFFVLIIWVYSIIHPLNQIKNYLEEVKQGKDVGLYMNREDEIGEVAQAIVEMRDELKKQENAKEEMVHNISHDLKTPIATIKSYAESIKDGIYPYGTLDKSVDVIVDNAQRLEDKVHNLLYLNRVEYLLTSDAEGVVTNMKDVVEEVVLNSAVLKPDIQIITEVDEVFFDGLLEAWRVVIENIMENAFRYAKSYIKIEVHEDVLKISNDGQKMPEDRVESLFRPYEKGEGGRFGLGLSIVSKVVKTNKYRVKGYNTDDGVCFEIYRPKKKQSRLDRKRREVSFPIKK